MTETDVAKLALLHLGDKGSIVDLATDATPEARKCRALFDVRRDALLRAYPWNFATKRARLKVVFSPIGVFYAVDGRIQFVHSGHNLSTGSRILIKDVGGTIQANGIWIVTLNGSSGIILDRSIHSGTYLEHTGKWVAIPIYGRAFQHALPADCLRVLCANEMPAGAAQAEFETEGGKLLIDAEEVTLSYIARIEDPGLWDALFVQAFSLDLAAALAVGLTQSSSRRAELMEELRFLLRNAFGTDALESSAWVIPASTDAEVHNVRVHGVWPANV